MTERYKKKNASLPDKDFWLSSNSAGGMLAPPSKEQAIPWIPSKICSPAASLHQFWNEQVHRIWQGKAIS